MTAPYYADDAVTLHHGKLETVLPTLADCSVDAIVTDPPYGLEFMGKGWDAPWTEAGINADAGFSSVTMSDGFNRLPRPSFTGSSNPSCLICGGKARGRRDGTSQRKVCTCPLPSFPNVRAVEMRAFRQWCEQWAAECLRVLKPGGYMIAFGGTRTWHRLVCAVEDTGFEIRDTIAWLYGSGFPKSHNLDGDHEGWGTALKPGFEPAMVARKPLAGTVAANVAAYGTGALHIDACRLEAGDDYRAKCASVVGLDSNRNGATYGQWTGTRVDSAHDAGRWPTNVAVDGQTAAELNGNARFFPTFRYQAKAPSSERPSVDGVAHETVKPLDLMRWLVRLVTPAGGLVLDPFAGSGTTAEACVIEGFRCIAIEQDAKYLPLITSRLTKPLQTALFAA